MKSSQIQVTNSMAFSYIGPPLDKGPLPGVCYFALSAKDSFESYPYNQPVSLLQSDTCRIFTVALPGHKEKHDPEKAMAYWAEKMRKGVDILSPFFHEVKQGIDYLIEKNFIIEKSLGVMGLSRGVFIAVHIASLCPTIRFILGFAPQTRLSYSKWFQEGPDVSYLDLERLVPKLYNRVIRFYIGNLDTRVGTRNAFDLVYNLAKEAKHHRIHSPPIEMMISPSIGYQGHGTPSHIFAAGVDWIKNIWEEL